MWMKRSTVLDQPCSTQRNFLRENKLMVRPRSPPMMSMTLRRMEQRQRQPTTPSYEFPTASSMGRCVATPPLIETQRRLIEGGRLGRAYNDVAAAVAQRSEKQIQTEDISDEEFLSAALLKCNEQSQLLRVTCCSEGDEPSLTLPVAALPLPRPQPQPLRRTVSNFELGKRPPQRPSSQRQIDDVAVAATAAVAVNSAAPEQPLALQLAMPDVTDVEQHPQLDQPLSTRTNASACDISAQSAVEEQQKQEQVEQAYEKKEQQTDPPQVLLTEQQRLSLLQAAQARYNQLIWQYNRLPISMGTLRVRNLKIELEHELDRLDGDLSVLTLPQVYIRRDQLQQMTSVSCC